MSKRPTKSLTFSAYLKSIDDEERRADCASLNRLMRRVTGKPAKMWSAKMVGYGSYQYRYASGRSGEWFAAGFSSGRPALSIYLIAPGKGHKALLTKLGKHKMAKSCLSVRRLADIDIKALEAIVKQAYQNVRRLYPASAARRK